MPTVVKILGGFLEVDLGETGGGGAPGYPSHPWVPPGGSPSHPWVPPGGSPSHPWVPPGGSPSHPIAPGGQPPGIWGGPGSLPPWVMPPIAPGGQLPGIWGGANEPFPTPPIFLPPNAPPVDPPTDTSRIEWKSGWTADKGWVTVGIVTPERPIPTPSS